MLVVHTQQKTRFSAGFSFLPQQEEHQNTQNPLTIPPSTIMAAPET